MDYSSVTEPDSADEEIHNTSYHGRDKDSERAGKDNMLKVCMSLCLITNTLLIGTVRAEEER
jgi:hypothetical protein